jgi:hypothetical protein
MNSDLKKRSCICTFSICYHRVLSSFHIKYVAFHIIFVGGCIRCRY